MISIDGDPRSSAEVPDPRACRAATLEQRKLEAIRDYVCICAADELEPSAILEIIENDYVHD